MRIIFLNERPDSLKKVYSDKTIAQLEKYGFENKVYSKADVMENPQAFADVKCVFSTWGMPEFSEDEIKTAFKSLECVFYAAGSVQKFAREFLNCGIRVFSAYAANAVPVAQYTAAQVLLANKGFFTLSDKGYCKERPKARELMTQFPGNFDVKVGIIGAGMIGSMVCEILKVFGLEIYVFDPFLSEEKAQKLGVTLCSLEFLFENCFVISNHLANNEQTKGMLGYDLFSKMQKNATFINTGRGAQVIEEHLIRVLSERPDITAILDVTEPEPPTQDSPFYTLENCILTPHIAGSSGLEVYRMSEYMKEQFENWNKGIDTKYEVTLEMLRTMA